MRILAIETSCDETAVAVAEFRNGRGQSRTYPRTNADKTIRVNVLSHLISSQVKIHAKFGGVVPNLARREHEKNLVPMLRSALTESHLLKKNPRAPANTSIHRCIEVEGILQREPELLRRFKKSIMPLTPPDIDAIAVTYGPGLAPALWVGVNFAHALAHLWNKPLIPVNHMAGHLFSAFLQKSGVKCLQPTTYNLPPIKFPLLALLVSGGHTELVLMQKRGIFKIIGETRDDAVGEAFDKVARILGLKYPGGPEIARLAEKGNPRAYALPRPMLHTKDYDFSFSGLKTAVLYLVRSLTQTKFGSVKKADIAAGFQAAAIEVLIKKTIRAAKEYKIKTLALGGGVAANALLRAALAAAIKKELPHVAFFIPDQTLCGDNALMIAVAAYFAGKKKSPEQAMSLRADANLRLG
ncbi:MAG: tRNA (adenosine(37)-N6)-threonylcarbamoyltransferase complex transferase subunit TsaD [Candidatus Sungiibacteriota bacterium]